MSRKSHKINIEEVIERAKQTAKVQDDKEIAAIFGTSPQSVANWKTRNAVPWPELYNFCIDYKISMDWLLTGVKVHQCRLECNEKMIEICKEVKEVLESNSHWAESLKSNVHSFWRGVEMDHEFNEIKKYVRKSLSDTAGKRHGTKTKPEV